MSEIVVVGSINADLVARATAHPIPGETVMGRSMAVLAGGKGANQAVAAALVGGDVALVGAVGSDAFAAPATELLEASGVDLTAVDKVPGETGVALITVSDDGENTIVVVPGANATVGAAAISRHRDLIANAEVVVLQGEIPRDGIEAAARVARGRVILNLAPVVQLDPEVIRLANPLIVNEHEALGALKILGGEVDPGSEESAVVGELIRQGVRSVIVTIGAAGALVATESGSVTHVSSPKVKAVDTTGAGDAFVGSLAARVAAGDDLQRATQFAVRVGAYAVTGHGAQASYPRSGAILPESTLPLRKLSD